MVISDMPPVDLAREESLPQAWQPVEPAASHLSRSSVLFHRPGKTDLWRPGSRFNPAGRAISLQIDHRLLPLP
jgi:hypothetical protein